MGMTTHKQDNWICAGKVVLAFACVAAAVTLVVCYVAACTVETLIGKAGR